MAPQFSPPAATVSGFRPPKVTTGEAVGRDLALAGDVGAAVHV